MQAGVHDNRKENLLTSDHDSTRRTVMTALAALPLGTAIAAPDTQSGQLRRIGSRSLVAFFSRSGNTRVVAGLIHRQRKTDLFEIRPFVPYPEDYEQTVEQARKESEASFMPSLEMIVPAIAGYDTVFLGFPIWGTTTPPIIRSFLAAHDLSTKTLIPFITHGGYGTGNSMSVLATLAPKARRLDGFVMEMDQERRTMERVTSWLRAVPRS